MKKCFNKAQILKSSGNCDKYSKSVSYETLVGGTATIGSEYGEALGIENVITRRTLVRRGYLSEQSTHANKESLFASVTWLMRLPRRIQRMLLVMTIPALALLFTIATIAESQAGTISCVNGKYANGTDCQSCGSDCNWSYDTESKHLEVFGSGDMYDYIQHSGGVFWDINGQEIPWIDKEIVSLNITGLNSVGRNAFLSKKGLKNLTLDTTITELHPGAFQGTRLETVSLPDSITDLGLYAFYSSRLKEIILTDSIVTIDHDAIVGTNNTNIVCKGANCEDIKTKLQQSGYTGKFSIAKDAKCNDANYYYTGLACIKEPDVTKRTCEYAITGYIKVGDYCASPEVTYAKKHYTPAEANQWLKDDDNFVVLTFKK